MSVDSSSCYQLTTNCGVICQTNKEANLENARKIKVMLACAPALLNDFYQKCDRAGAKIAIAHGQKMRLRMARARSSWKQR